MDEREDPSGCYVGFVRNNHNFVSFVYSDHGTVLLSDHSKNLSGGDPPAVAEWIRFTCRDTNPSNPQSKLRMYVNEYEKILAPSDIPIRVWNQKEKAVFLSDWRAIPKPLFVECEIHALCRDENGTMIFYNEFLGRVFDFHGIIKYPSEKKLYSATVISMRSENNSHGSMFAILSSSFSRDCTGLTPSEESLREEGITTTISKEMEQKGLNQSEVEIPDRSQDGFVRGLCCRSFGTSMVIWTREGSAVLNESCTRPICDQKVRLGMWIWCKVRSSESGFLAAKERYRYLVTEYEEAAPISGVVATKRLHFLMIDIDVWLLDPVENVYESAVFLRIFDKINVIMNADKDHLYRVCLRNTPVDEGDGCMKIVWDIHELKATKSRNFSPSSVGNLNEPEAMNVSNPSASVQATTSSFARLSVQSTAKSESQRDSAGPLRKSVFQNDENKRVQKQHYVDVCDIYDSDEEDEQNYVESSSNDDIIESEASIPEQSLVPQHSSSDPSVQTWEQICRQMMTYKNVRQAMRNDNPDLFNDIVDKLLQRT